MENTTISDGTTPTSPAAYGENYRYDLLGDRTGMVLTT